MVFVHALRVEIHTERLNDAGASHSNRVWERIRPNFSPIFHGSLNRIIVQNIALPSQAKQFLIMVGAEQDE